MGVIVDVSALPHPSIHSIWGYRVAAGANTGTRALRTRAATFPPPSFLPCAQLRAGLGALSPESRPGTAQEVDALTARLARLTGARARRPGGNNSGSGGSSGGEGGLGEW